MGVLNGLAERAITTADTINVTDQAVISSIRSIFLAIVPVGSSNGVAWTLGLRDVFEAVQKIALGLCKDVDLYKIAAPDMPSIWDCLGTSVGLFALVDDLAENTLRWMDPTLKQIVSAFLAIYTFKPCSGTICFE